MELTRLQCCAMKTRKQINQQNVQFQFPLNARKKETISSNFYVHWEFKSEWRETEKEPALVNVQAENSWEKSWWSFGYIFSHIFFSILIDDSFITSSFWKQKNLESDVCNSKRYSAFESINTKYAFIWLALKWLVFSRYKMRNITDVTLSVVDVAVFWRYLCLLFY